MTARLNDQKYHVYSCHFVAFFLKIILLSLFIAVIIKFVYFRTSDIKNYLCHRNYFKHLVLFLAFVKNLYQWIYLVTVTVVHMKIEKLFEFSHEIGVFLM